MAVFSFIVVNLFLVQCKSDDSIIILSTVVTAIMLEVHYVAAA